MSDDRWRDSYDAWKTRVPDDEQPTCELCGGWLRRNAANLDWVCEWCDEHEEEDVADLLVGDHGLRAAPLSRD